MKRQLNVFVVDDHTLVRDAFACYLDDNNGIRIIGQAGTDAEGLESVVAAQPDVVLIAISLPILSAIEATERLIAADPDLKLVALSIHSEETCLMPFIEAGGLGFIRTTAIRSELLQAIQQAYLGEAFLSPQGVQVMVKGRQVPLEPSKSESNVDVLSEREKQVLIGIIHGYNMRQIGERLFLTKSTIETYKRRIYEKLKSLSLRLPTEQLATGILDGSVAEDVCAIMSELDFPEDDIEKIKSNLLLLQGGLATKKELITEMRQEYTRLFTHPKKPSVDIYETVFLYNPEEENEQRPSLFISPAAMDAERCYKKAGLVMSKEINEPGDHMATEMEFMMFLYMQKAKALHENNAEETARREKEIQDFMGIHLQKWGKDFFNLCISSSKHDAYRIFGEIGKIYMERMLPC